MTDWLSYADRDPIPGVTDAPYDEEKNPTWKLLLHTTEGATYQVARAAYVNGGFSPHVTVGPDPNQVDQVHCWQHVSFAYRATALADDPGGIRTNRDYVLQVEIVGFCDPNWSSSPLYIHNWPLWYQQGVAAVLNDMLTARPIPRVSTVTWVEYPASYGERAPQRLKWKAYDAYSGILGHEHAPENSHGDPGDVSAFLRTYLLT
ncbi:hypothetical protein SAMN05421678_11851 [Actinopolymorpha cephalotaxi]|uniref:N-acetylmuramoyl-L-alanine amidase n=1 Tax=Actinopolymorpha cephalotaxi TaxID=504797 RepID=A0A1I3A553_9ACTN|nr:hypothetical protein SAMN05421678_11851 [Actinopolymorpha cephalotaxi]